VPFGSKILAIGAPPGVGTFGIPRTLSVGFANSGGTITADNTWYIRMVEGGSFSKIVIYVQATSGNIAVAVYRNSGSGAASTPAARVGTSGSVPCPSVGIAEISLGATVSMLVGDWMALGADNVTATFTRYTGALSVGTINGIVGTNATYPPADPAGALAYSNFNVFAMSGLP
jgi:hypothetical protein